MLHYTLLYFTVLHYTTLYYTYYCVVFNYITLLHCSMSLYYTIFYYAISRYFAKCLLHYCTILNYTIHTMQLQTCVLKYLKQSEIPLMFTHSPLFFLLHYMKYSTNLVKASADKWATESERQTKTERRGETENERKIIPSYSTYLCCLHAMMVSLMVRYKEGTRQESREEKDGGNC